MRLNVRDIGFKASAAQDSPRPIRLRIGGLTYSMTTSEALELAHQLADAVNELKTQEKTS